MMAEAVPPTDDKNLIRLPSRLYFKQVGLFKLGCTRHSCIYCDCKGCKARVHASFLQGGLKCKAEEDCPPSTIERALKMILL
jgi:hypothetical protein